MPKSILFIATLHHADTLRQEQAQARQANKPMPLFPSSASQGFMARALEAYGYRVGVVWRNAPRNDVARVQTFRYTQGITLDKLAGALLRRLPATLNPQIRARNAELVVEARHFKPDVLWLVGDNAVILPQTLALLKEELGCKLIYASGTSPIVFSSPIERAAARLYDSVLVNDYYHGIQWQELGAKHMLALPIVAIDPDFHRPRTLTDDQRAQYACDVSFVGTLLPYALYSERIHALESLHGFNIGVWTVHDLPASLQPFYRGKALGSGMMDVLSASPITLNTHGDFMRYGGNMRLFEAAGVGAFQLCDDRPGVREWFKVGEHVAVYKDAQDLREHVAYYLAHPQERERMAQAARAHALAHHTYAHRVARLQSEGVL